jgi:N-acetylglutamate synthase-like GNAT family acetyltransferase
MSSHWLRYTWDLGALPEQPVTIASPLVVRPAEESEKSAVLTVTANAFSMDTGWADIHKSLLSKLQGQIAEAFAEKEPSCIVLQYGNRIIGCSVLRTSEESDTHLITGPCVLHEFRSRGMGSSLLGASLAALRKAGLRRAFGVSREKTVAARFLFPKFGGQSEPWHSEFEAAPKIAA